MKKINLSTEEEKRLKDSLLCNNSDLIARKVRTILFLARGERVTKAMEVFGLSKDVVYRYINQFEKEGVEGLLKIKPITGRPSRLPDNIGEIITDTLKRSPAAIEELDTAAHNWTIELMRDYLEIVHNIVICFSYMGRIMQKYGIKHIYSRAIMTSPDPQYEEKREVVETLKKTWKPRPLRKVKECSSKMK
jgi:transposase